jgi:hypothetical protein
MLRQEFLHGGRKARKGCDLARQHRPACKDDRPNAQPGRRFLCEPNDVCGHRRRWSLPCLERLPTMSGAIALYDNGTTTLASVSSVSCPIDSFCMIVGAEGEAITVSGSVLTDRTAAGHAWNNVPRYGSCSSDTECVVVDKDGNAYFWDGKSWSSSVFVTSAGLSAIACSAGSTSCVAIDNSGHVWMLQPPVSQSGNYVHRKLPGKMKSGMLTLSRASCTGPTYCVSSDGQGGVYQIIGDAIGPRIVLDGGRTLFGPSCVSGGSPPVATCTSVSKDGTKVLVGKTPLERLDL